MPDLRTRKQGVDWPRFLGPGGDGKSPETSLKLAWGKDGPTLRWVKPVGEGYSAPSIARGRLFMFDRHGDRASLTGKLASAGIDADLPFIYSARHNEGHATATMAS